VAELHCPQHSPAAQLQSTVALPQGLALQLKDVPPGPCGGDVAKICWTHSSSDRHRVPLGPHALVGHSPEHEAGPSGPASNEGRFAPPVPSIGVPPESAARLAANPPSRASPALPPTGKSPPLSSPPRPRRAPPVEPAAPTAAPLEPPEACPPLPAAGLPAPGSITALPPAVPDEEQLVTSRTTVPTQPRMPDAKASVVPTRRSIDKHRRICRWALETRKARGRAGTT
jgi:hypothetical protein